MDAGRRVLPPSPSTLGRDALREPRHCSDASEVFLREAGAAPGGVCACVRARRSNLAARLHWRLDTDAEAGGELLLSMEIPQGLKSRLSQTFDITHSPARTLLQNLVCRAPTKGDVSGIRRRKPLCYSSHIYRLQKRIKKKKKKTRLAKFFPLLRLTQKRTTVENSESAPASAHLLNKP